MSDSFHRSLGRALDRALNDDLWLDAHDLALHNHAEAHLDACYDALVAIDLDETDPAEVADPAYGPFCGCNTCVVREVLTAAWHFVTEVADG